MKKLLYILSLLLLAAPQPLAQRMHQRLGRGVVAVYGRSNGNAGVEITWRRLAQEPEDAKYNVYVSATGDAFTLVNEAPLTLTNYATTLAAVPYGSYVAVTLAGDAAPSDSEIKAQCKPFLFENKGLRNIYMEIRYDASPLDKTRYTTKFVWPCDLDGDGEYDYVVDRCPVDGSVNYYVEGYLADGTFLWNIDLGPNEKPCDGQNDNMCAYDIDCDGYGELIVQTSDGSRFWDKASGTWGKYVLGKDTGDSDGDGFIDYSTTTTKNPPRYMTVVDGMTGAEKASVEFLYDDAYNRTNKAQLMGDEYNKHEAHVGIFYHDGVHPAICGEWLSRDINKQHHYRNCAFAYDFDKEGKATNWHQLFMKDTGGEVFHMIRIFDADGDGRDEMSSGAYVMDHDGTTLYNTGICHGDRHRTADIDPERPGLETFSIQQNAPDMLGMILFDAGTGETIKRWYLSAVGDVGRGECLDLDPGHPGWEMFSTMEDYQIYDAKGNKIEGKKGYFPTEGLWWDGQLDRENVNSPDGNGYNAMIVDYTDGRLIEMAKESNWTLKSSFGKRGKYWGDIIGDWREELVLIREIDGVCEGIVGFSTDYKTDVDNIYCLQQDPHYRGDCTTRGYYQTPCPAFYLGYGMPRPQLPPFMTAGTDSDVFGIADGDTEISPRQGISNVYAMPVKGQTLTLAKPLAPATTLWKSQQGTLALIGDHTNRVVISEGTIRLDGSLANLDLRARGTIAGSGSIGDVKLEGALHHQGCRIMPNGTITFAKGLHIDHKSYIEITRPGADIVAVEGALSVTAPLIFSFNEVPTEGDYRLLMYGSFDNAQLKYIDVRGLTATPYEIKAEDGALILTVSSQRKAVAGVVWTGAESAVWDYNTQNFAIAGSPTTFVEGDGVVFNDDATRATVTISEMMPASTATFAAVEKAYTINGNGGISGRTILQSGKVTFKELNCAFEIGKSILAVNNSNASCEQPVLLTDTATIQISSGTTTLKGKITGEGTLLKTGAGQLNVTYPGANSWTGTILHGGTIAMGAWNTTIGKSNSPIHVTGNSTFTVFNNNSSSEVPTVQNVITIDPGVTLTFHAGKRCAIKGSLKGEGTYKIDFPYVRGDVYTNTSQFEGTYHVTTDNCRFVQAMDLSKATLRLDKGAVAASMAAGSGNERNYTHKVGTLTGAGTLGAGTWNVSALTYSGGPTIINGTLNLVSPVIDVTALCKGTLKDDAELQILTVNGKATLTGTPIIIPGEPKEGFVWDVSTLATDGVLRVAAAPDGIASVYADETGDAVIYDLMGRPVTHPTPGIYIVNGKKITIND